jgi:hypothetical protein
LLRKPLHKPTKTKYDKTSLIQEKTVDVFTKEDNFNLFDMPWISNLRNMNNTEVAKLKSKASLGQTIPSPPSFYDDDLRKVTSRTAKMKDQFKKNIECDNNPTELLHLFKHTSKGTPTNAEINFGLRLRSYKSVNNFKNANPWKFPGLKGAKEAIAFPSCFSSTISQTGITSPRGPVKIKGRNSKNGDKYSDKFPQSNANGIRQMFSQNSQLGSIKWGSSLRWNDDKHKKASKRFIN